MVGFRSGERENHCDVESREIERFNYEGTLEEDYLRVIELLPGSESNIIDCKLTRELRQDTKNTYTAISYAWGDPKHTEEILCCDKVLSISTSLAGALRTIRSKKPHSSQRIWADAICINQRCDEEKNRQVKHIGQVYKNATRVIVWLGPDANGIAFDCFQLLEKWNIYLGEQLRIHGHIRNIPYLEPPPPLCNYLDRGGKLRELVCLPWFSRVWVIQEAALAKDCLLFWGDQVMKFEEFMEFACFCNGRTDFKKIMGDYAVNLDLWGSIFRCLYCNYDNDLTWRYNKPLIKTLARKKNPQIPGLFLDVLQFGKSFSASYAQDHVNAFLGNSLALSADGTRLLEPSYGQANNAGNVYYEMACAFLKSRESAYVLCFVQHCSAEEVTGNNGSSWIPQWRKATASSLSLFTIGNVGLGQNTGGSAKRLQYLVRRDIGAGGQHQLTLQGFEFDQIVWTSEVLQSDNFALDPNQWDETSKTLQQPYIEALWQKMSHGYEICDCEKKTFDYTRYHGDFSFALVAGYMNNRNIRPREHKKVFTAYLKGLDWVRNAEPDGKNGALSGKELSNAYRFEQDTKVCTGRRLAITKFGQFALVPRFSLIGDRCYVLLGMATPFVLRPAAVQSENAKCFHLVGEAYVSGIMRGELVDALDRNKKTNLSVTLV